MREGIIYPKFADKFYRLDFDAHPLPVLSLYPFPAPMALTDVTLSISGLEASPRLIPWQTISHLPAVTTSPPLICQIFNWSEAVAWEGIRLVDLLDFLKIDTHPEGYFAFYSRDGVFFGPIPR
jgi:DMSO/TMAO reductase YedYZ molybdopterin-dependent catalytic subunit